MALDVGASATPRYLLPSTSSAFSVGKVATDRLYQQLEEELQGARPFPSSGVPEARERGAIRTELKKLLGL
jgi:thiamine pyridinylase